jgi:NodT family efflux transporter outer membrane factor (OMF) lipoprotein
MIRIVTLRTGSALALTSMMAAMLTGCAVGPQHPTTDLSLSPAVGAGTIAPVSGPAQTIDPGAPTPANWWHQFGSPKIDTLVDRALAANNDLASADASLRQARALAGVALGGALPQVDVGYSAERSRVSNQISPPLADANQTLYTLHTAQVSVGFPLDIFGLQRNRIKSARAQAEVARQHLLAARTTVVGNVVLAAIQHASLMAQVTAAQSSIASNRRVVELLERRQQLGDVGARDVAAQMTSLANAEAALPPLQRALEHQGALISTLIGVAPGSPLPDLPVLDEISLPTSLPVSLPGDIVTNRPDVRAAEARMKGAGNDVGVAIASRLPQITLSATAGGAATDFGSMFASGNPFWQLLGGLTQPLFHGGALLRQQQAAEAALDGAKADYRQAVLLAFTDVSDALTGLRTDGAALDAATRANDAATRTLGFTRRQAELGSIDSLALLSASALEAQAALNLVQAKAARLADTVALYQATGGGVEGK